MFFRISTQNLKKVDYSNLFKFTQNYSRYAFSTATSEQLLNENVLRFREKYNQNLKAFREKVQALESKNAQGSLKKPNGTVYNHPYHSDHHPLNFSPVKTAEFFHDFIGPEQVSPHYENFMVARKFAVAFWVGSILLSFASMTVDLHWMMKSSFIPFFFWMQIMYFYIEGRKSLFKPLLARFYRRVAANEIHNFEVFYHENVENKLRNMIRVAKSQIDYYQLHSQYHNIKADSINNFMANEHLNLQKNIQERALNVLKTAQDCEARNQEKYVQDIIESTQSEIDKALVGANAKDIQKQMLSSAILGISQGVMRYENDPILPLVKDSIKQKVAAFQALSEAEKLSLVALTDQQLKEIKEADERAKVEFLTSMPSIDNAVKSNEGVKRILATWGK